MTPVCVGGTLAWGRILVDLLAMLRIIAAVGLLALARSESYDEDFAIDLCVTPRCLKRS